MKITPTKLEGVMHIGLTPIEDERGFFARSFCAASLAEAGHSFEVVQANLSYNHKAGTLRGMHYQADPQPDPKIVRCEQGAIFDVVVDLRPKSPSYLKWTGSELTADNGNALLVPAGCAHGFISLVDESKVLYLMGAPYVAELARGVRWDDPAFDIQWPMAPATINPRDASYPDYQPEKPLL